MIEALIPEPSGDKWILTATVPHAGGFLVVHTIVANEVLNSPNHDVDELVMSGVRASVEHARLSHA